MGRIFGGIYTLQNSIKISGKIQRLCSSVHFNFTFFEVIKRERLRYITVNFYYFSLSSSVKDCVLHHETRSSFNDFFFVDTFYIFRAFLCFSLSVRWMLTLFCYHGVSASFSPHTQRSTPHHDPLILRYSYHITTKKSQSRFVFDLKVLKDSS